ncbi:MAG: glycerate-2-kinase family protein, partial [Chloroflexota bacterium]
MAAEPLTGLMPIKNRGALATSPARTAALDIIEAGINRVLPSAIMEASLAYDAAAGVLRVQSDAYPVSGGRIFVAGGGKAAGLMAVALEAIVPPEKITAGVVTDKGGGYAVQKIKVITAGHPLPDLRGVRGVREMLRLRARYDIGANDLVLALLSGGGSALLPYPVRGVTLADKQRATELLLSSGAGIAEVNTVRKHLSRV